MAAVLLLALAAPLPFGRALPWHPDPVGVYDTFVRGRPYARVEINADGSAAYRYLREGGPPAEPHRGLRWEASGGRVLLLDDAGIGRYWLPCPGCRYGGEFTAKRVKKVP